MEILKVALIIFLALLVLNLLIFVHELGHFLAARWRGMKVDRFAIWFGKPIWKKKISGVEYALGWIPAGGYVALPQMATMEAIEGKSDSSDEPLPPVSPMDKIIVAFAGPLFSFLLAVAFAVVVWGVGRPVAAAEETTTIGWVKPGGPAWKAGLRPGDQVVAIDGRPVTQFSAQSEDSVTWRIITSGGTNIAITYVRDGEQHTAHAVPFKRETKWYERKALRQVQIAPEEESIVYGVVSNSPAAVAGLQRGDKVVELNGEKVYSPLQIMAAEDAMTNGPITPMTLTVRRGDDQFVRTLVPEKPLSPPGTGPSLGILGWEINTNEKLVHPSPLEQVQKSAGQIFATLGVVFSKGNDIGVQQLGGPVMIIRAYKAFLDTENGWRRVLWFSVVLNVNLALLNMLPLPVLDGGHIVLSFIEIVRRRPVSVRIIQYIQTACALFLIGFMLFIAFFDAGDWFRSARDDREQRIVFSPKN